MFLGKAKLEYINRLAFLLYPIMEKLPEDIAYQIQGLLVDCGIEVEPKSHNVDIAAILPPNDQETQDDDEDQDGRQGEQEADDAIFVV